MDRPKTALPVDEIAAEYRAGKTTYELGETYGVSSEMIRRRLIECGVERRSLKVVLPVDEIAAEYQAGKSMRELGETYGVSDATIRRRLIECGVERRGKGECYRKRGGPLCVTGGYMGSRDRNGYPTDIHRACWEAYYGSIPSGFSIHHIDGDRLNNEIDNLACMPSGEHVALHNRARSSNRR